MFSQSRMYTSRRIRCVRLSIPNSTREQEIIEHPSSCYVIGRSGTGKTTTMLFKMLGIHRIWKMHPDMGLKPRQLFITQSRVLARKVEEYFGKLLSSLEDAACSSEELRMREKNIEQEADFIDQDDNQQWRSDLPQNFSELRDEHFPLFITYDRVRISSSSEGLVSPYHRQLCTMLQNDIGQGNSYNGFNIPVPTRTLGGDPSLPTGPTSSRRSRRRARLEILPSPNYKQQPHRKFVSYHVFLTSYWCHLPQTLTQLLGEKRWLTYDPPDNSFVRSCLSFWGVHGSNQGIRRYSHDEIQIPRSRCL